MGYVPSLPPPQPPQDAPEWTGSSEVVKKERSWLWYPGLGISFSLVVIFISLILTGIIDIIIVSQVAIGIAGTFMVGAFIRWLFDVY